MNEKLTKEYQTRKANGKLSPSQIKKLDTLFQIQVLEKSSYGSIFGGTAEVAHHFKGRRNLATRWYLPNGIPLTDAQHQLKDLNEQVREIKGRKWEKDIYNQSLKSIKYLDYYVIVDHLMGLRENYL